MRDDAGADQIRIVEVSPRDGLQNLKGPIVPLETKLELINRLLRAGMRNIEVGSFVRADRIPQMGDSAILLGMLTPPSQVKFDSTTSVHDPLSGIPPVNDSTLPTHATGVHYPVLVPNMRGLESLLALEEKHRENGGKEKLTDEIAVFVSATEVSDPSIDLPLCVSLRSSLHPVGRARGGRIETHPRGSTDPRHFPKRTIMPR